MDRALEIDNVVEEIHQITYHSVGARRARGKRPCEVCGKIDPLPFDIIRSNYDGNNNRR